jgi:hypothetical protein
MATDGRAVPKPVTRGVADAVMRPYNERGEADAPRATCGDRGIV